MIRFIIATILAPAVLSTACGSTCPTHESCRDHHIVCLNDVHLQCGNEPGDYEACVGRLSAQCDDKYRNCLDCYK